MNGVTIPGVSAGSNHVGASEMWTPQVSWPSGVGAAGTTAPAEISRTRTVTERRGLIMSLQPGGSMGHLYHERLRYVLERARRSPIRAGMAIRLVSGPGDGAPRGSGGGVLSLRDCSDAGEHRGRIAVQDLLARFLTDLRFRKRLLGPLAAELGAVGAAHDAVGAVQAHARFDRARAERVAIHVHLRLPEARRRQLLIRRVEQAAMV